jgi:hypothetical protein
MKTTPTVHEDWRGVDIQQIQAKLALTPACDPREICRILNDEAVANVVVGGLAASLARTDSPG